jgi:hypothetical protein
MQAICNRAEKMAQVHLASLDFANRGPVPFSTLLMSGPFNMDESVSHARTLICMISPRLDFARAAYSVPSILLQRTQYSEVTQDGAFRRKGDKSK